MRYGSVCSGIEAATVAWHPLGWQPAWFSEIEPFPSAVLKHHYPGVRNFGDFTTIRPRILRRLGSDPINVLVGGTPCQSFSVAGKRLGLDDPRGNLALEYCLLARRLRPRWVVWENVPGVLSSWSDAEEGQTLEDGTRDCWQRNDFDTFLGFLGECGYGTAWRILDAQYYGVPQRRRRVFVVGHLRDWRPAAAVLFERESLRGYPAPRREPGQGITRDTAPCLTNSGRGVERGGDTRGQGPAIAVHATGDGREQESHEHLVCSTGDIAHCLNAGGMGRIDYETETMIAHTLRGDLHRMAIRRLTPIECERLQGFRDNYTLIPYPRKPAADGPRCKALGNSMAVPVMRWLGERIQAADDAMKTQVAKIA